MDIRHAVGVKAGVPAETLGDIPRYRKRLHFSAREGAAPEFCRRLADDDLEVTDDCFRHLREHFAEAEIVELTFIIGYQILASKFVKAFRLEPQGFSRVEVAVPGR